MGKKHIEKIMSYVNEGQKILDSGNTDDFGRLLHSSWLEKKSLSKLITNSKIDELYIEAINHGALGGKLLGAGGGGFLLFYVEPHNHKAVIHSLSDLYHVPVGLDFGGTRITYYDQTKI